MSDPCAFPMPEKTAAHEKLTRFAGDWVGEEKMYPSPWDPKGGTALGKSSYHLVCSGFAAAFDCSQERDGQVTFEGHGVMAVDPKEGEYILHWFDSMGASREEYRGNFEGEDLILRSRNPMGHHRLVWKLGGSNKMSFHMFMSQDGAEWQPLMDGHYTKA